MTLNDALHGVTDIRLAREAVALRDEVVQTEGFRAVVFCATDVLSDQGVPLWTALLLSHGMLTQRRLQGGQGLSEALFGTADAGEELVLLRRSVSQTLQFKVMATAALDFLKEMGTERLAAVLLTHGMLTERLLQEARGNHERTDANASAGRAH